MTKYKLTYGACGGGDERDQKAGSYDPCPSSEGLRSSERVHGHGRAAIHAGQTMPQAVSLHIAKRCDERGRQSHPVCGEG